MRAKSLAGKPAIGVEAMNTASSNRANSKTIGGASSTNNRTMSERPVGHMSVNDTRSDVCPPVGVITAPKHTPPIIEPYLAEQLPSGDFYNMCKGQLHSAYEETRPESWDQMTPTDKAKWEESHSYESYLEDCIPKVDGKDARAQYEETRPESWDQMSSDDQAKWEESHSYSEWLENTVIEDMKEVALYPNAPHVGYAAGHAEEKDEEKEDHMNGDHNTEAETNQSDNDAYNDTETKTDTDTQRQSQSESESESLSNAEAGTTEAGTTEAETDSSTFSEHENGKSPATKPPGMPESDWIKSQSHNETSYNGKTLLSKLEHAANEASSNAFDRESALAEILPPETPDEGAGIEKD